MFLQKKGAKKALLRVASQIGIEPTAFRLGEAPEGHF